MRRRSCASVIRLSVALPEIGCGARQSRPAHRSQPPASCRRPAGSEVSVHAPGTELTPLLARRRPALRVERSEGPGCWVGNAGRGRVRARHQHYRMSEWVGRDDDVSVMRDRAASRHRTGATRRRREGVGSHDLDGVLPSTKEGEPVQDAVHSRSASPPSRPVPSRGTSPSRPGRWRGAVPRWSRRGWHAASCPGAFAWSSGRRPRTRACVKRALTAKVARA